LVVDDYKKYRLKAKQENRSRLTMGVETGSIAEMWYKKN
jgi:hypothetical protein